MDAYSLPWFDPLEEAEARAEAVDDGLRAGADTLIEGWRASRIEGSRHHDEGVSAVVLTNPVSYLSGPSGAPSWCLDNITAPGGVPVAL